MTVNSIYVSVAGRWLDKLGVSARMGIDVVIRQSFFHGHYALLDDYMHPRPVRISVFDRVSVYCWVCNQPPRSTQPSTLRGMVK